MTTFSNCTQCLKKIPFYSTKCPYCGKSFIITPKTVYEPAGFWIRVCALSIDFFLMAAFSTTCLALIVRMDNKLLFYLLLGILLLYKPLAESLWGKTAGKKVSAIHIQDKNQRRISLIRSVIRFMPFIPLVLLYHSQLAAFL
ncbi:MAG: RDD family protein, partial [Candidatus Omnitrophota bacterium]